eukprot:jgi/Ulvmu1/10958/UM007_0137.1
MCGGLYDLMQLPPTSHLHIPGSGTYCSSIGAEELAKLPKTDWKGRVVVVETAVGAQQAVAQILCHCRSGSKQQPIDAALGFCFWPPCKPPCGQDVSPEVPIALQVATSTVVYIFHLPSLQVQASIENTENCVAVLQPLFAAPDVFKCGVGVSCDNSTVQALTKQLQLRGIVDLGPLAYRAGFKQQSLGELSALLLGHVFVQPTPPSDTSQASGMPVEQLRRMGTCAWVCRELAVKLAPLWLPI